MRIDFVDAPEGKKLHWLICDGPEFDICHQDPGGEVDVWIECELVAFAEIWMGWKPLSAAIREKVYTADGPRQFAENPFRRLGQSRLSGIGKRPSVDTVKAA